MNLFGAIRGKNQIIALFTLSLYPIRIKLSLIIYALLRRYTVNYPLTFSQHQTNFMDSMEDERAGSNQNFGSHKNTSFPTEMKAMKGKLTRTLSPIFVPQNFSRDN